MTASHGDTFDLCLITDRNACRGRSLAALVEEALRGGADLVQVREKDLATTDLLALATEMRAITKRHGKRLVVNDRIDVAVSVGADGVHLPASSFAISDARQLLGEERIIGVSTHSVAEAETAERSGADYVVLGPVFDTPSKRAYGTPLGLDSLARAACSLSIPILAVGGIDASNVEAVRRTGVTGVAVIRALCSSTEPARAAQLLTASGPR